MSILPIFITTFLTVSFPERLLVTVTSVTLRANADLRRLQYNTMIKLVIRNAEALVGKNVRSAESAVSTAMKSLV